MAVPLDRDLDFVGCTAERNMFQKIDHRVGIEIIGGKLLQRRAHLGERLSARDLVDGHGYATSVGRAGGSASPKHTIRSSSMA